MLMKTSVILLALSAFAAHAEEGGPYRAESAPVTAMVPAGLLYEGADLHRTNLSADDLVKVSVLGDGSATPDRSWFHSDQ